MRLLAKLPENRYQSVAGLLADLRRCHGTLTEGGEIAEFTTGLRDTLSATDPSATLYASHPQAARLTAVLEKVSQSGTSCLVMITGAPGTGKSSLIFSALKHIQAEKVLLTVSKADRYSPVIPYALVTAALRSLTLHILGMPAAELTRWKSRILQAVGDCAGLAVNLVPELGLLLNLKSQTPTETDFVNAGAQFTLTACNLIKAFATAELPLVILIDDIHWADEASLHLFENLFKHHEAIPLMLIVTQRDLASLPCSLIHAHLTRLRHAANNVVEIMPEPLTVKAVARWLASVLHVRASTTTGLAQLIHEKTGGNPLFVQEFYQQAALDGLITSAKHTGKWSYDRKAIMARRYTENVASRVMQQLSVMPEQTKDLLGSLACLGGSGNLTLLSQVKYLTREEINDRLAPAVQAQLISLTGDNYAFTHDRVHETAFALIAAEAQNHLHYRAASQLAEQISHSEGNDALFRAVYHIALITGTPPASARAEEFYSLVFLAAKRAKNTGDYASALRFLQTARTLKPQRPFILMLEEAECEFLHGNLASALNICGKMLSAPGDLTEKARAACLMAEIHMRQSDIPLALETTIAWLAVFGIHFIRHPDNDECDAARTSLQQRVGRDPHSAFMPLALMQDHEIESVMNLLASSTVFAILSARDCIFCCYAKCCISRLIMA
ncbi:AAA family ATPase [Pantoea sp. LMR881]|uniref:ATP-binding protein n=1 Tax=Pantoea sp. LMR881 TaxID=3014336 RepID=UPI0022B0114B|nr:AAA family ATPase [Pantoea sp. LMR881]MCZ4061461.1 AAA family ATPase [Pantoea sp. LMR881]